MWLCKSYISCEDGEYIKGEVYNDLPSNKKYYPVFVEVNTVEKVEKKEIEINEEKIETASLKRRGRPKKRK